MPRQQRVRRSAAPVSLGTGVSKVRLDNGLTVICCERPELAQAYVALYFGVGSRHESARDNGITHVLEHMVFRGTRSFSDPTAVNAAAVALGVNGTALEFRKAAPRQDVNAA